MRNKDLKQLKYLKRYRSWARVRAILSEPAPAGTIPYQSITRPG